jgi:hypothetical protein
VSRFAAGHRAALAVLALAFAAFAATAVLAIGTGAVPIAPQKVVAILAGQTGGTAACAGDGG